MGPQDIGLAQGRALPDGAADPGTLGAFSEGSETPPARAGETEASGAGDPAARLDFARHAVREEGGAHSLHLIVDGIHCGGCVRTIERALTEEADVSWARVNMTTRRLVVRWRGAAARADALAAKVIRLGYRLAPYDPATLAVGEDRAGRDLLRSLAVAGFAAGNVMLLSISVWAGQFQDMGPATRALMHWISALIALPAIVYAGRPFYRSAVSALGAGRLNMDVPIALAVLLTAAMSLFQTVRGAEHVYFDSAVALLFFLLVGRYLDHRARGRARSAAQNLLSLRASAATVVDTDGSRRVVAPDAVPVGATVLAAAGERIAVDGRIREGTSDVDTSLITGESVPVAVGPGDRVYQGTLNLSAPLLFEATAAGEGTVLAEIVRLMEVAEQGRARYVRVADRAARLYAPLVHTLAAATFAGWWAVGGAPWETALLYAVAVLVITCPCALALAVPAVQVVASGRLLRRGVLLKSATALERLAEVDTVVFDKTGTLTPGRPELPAESVDAEALACAAALAGASTHPLARALVRAAPRVAVAKGVRETPGAGLALTTAEGEIRLGSRAWCGVEDHEGDDEGPELWLARPGRDPVRFGFADRPRSDARDVVAALARRGYGIELVSGDRKAAVRRVAEEVGIRAWRAGVSPQEKCARLQALAAAGRRPLMVGDGLNDAPALAAAYVSLSPTGAADISQTAADAVFQGERLGPVVETLDVARRAGRLVRQNFALAIVYNAATIPLAAAGLVTPLVAALAMSASSLVVTANALRLGR